MKKQRQCRTPDQVEKEAWAGMQVQSNTPPPQPLDDPRMSAREWFFNRRFEAVLEANRTASDSFFYI